MMTSNLTCGGRTCTVDCLHVQPSLVTLYFLFRPINTEKLKDGEMDVMYTMYGYINAEV